MIGLVDYHMHTVLSDGQNDHEEMVLAAIEKGLDEIGFTDHVDGSGAGLCSNFVCILLFQVARSTG